MSSCVWASPICQNVIIQFYFHFQEVAGRKIWLIGQVVNKDCVDVENNFQCTHSWHHHISGHFLWMLPLRRCSRTPHWRFPPLQYTMLWCVAFRLKKLWTLQVETEVAFSSQWTCRVLSVSGLNRASKEQSKKNGSGAESCTDMTQIAQQMEIFWGYSCSTVWWLKHLFCFVHFTGRVLQVLFVCLELWLSL